MLTKKSVSSLMNIFERCKQHRFQWWYTRWLQYWSWISAFRKWHSCESALLNMVEDFKDDLDKGKYVVCVSMDLSKAFDCLPHCFTLCKLKAYGLSTNPCKLIASYLYKKKTAREDKCCAQQLGRLEQRHPNIWAINFQYLFKWYFLFCECE